MSKATSHYHELDRPALRGRMIDRYAMIPLLACAYSAIVFPLILASCDYADMVCRLEVRPENKIVWPSLAAVSIVWAVRHRSRLSFPPHIICLFVYLAFAGMSVAWAFNPELSFIRFSQQTMVIASILLPAMLAARTVEMMRGLFICFAVGALLNVAFVLGRPPINIEFTTWGYPGYFSGKNYLGEFAAVALLLSVHEMLQRGHRRILGIIVATMALALLILSNSKTALGLVILAPLFAQATLMISRRTGLSVAVLLLSIPLGYAVLSTVSGFSVNRLSYELYGDPTFTGRTIIWDFANSEIARKPLLGWGYQSFWLAGPDAPSITDAPGWVKTMPNAHNGYLDTKLEMGYVGFAILISFLVATLHAIGRMANRDYKRAWLVLSLALYVITTNGFESLWMRGFEFLWVIFVIIAAETARFWQPFVSPRPVHAVRSRKLRRPSPSRAFLGPARGRARRDSVHAPKGEQAAH